MSQPSAPLAVPAAADAPHAGPTPDPLLLVDPELRQAAAEVDRTLIRWALSLTPRQRLDAATRAARALGRFHHDPSDDPSDAR